MVGRNDLFRFSQSVTNLVSFAILLTLGFGLGCAFFVSIGLAQPVAQLSKELADAQERHQAVPEFSRTGIRELDRLADAIVTLSTDNYKAAAAASSTSAITTPSPGCTVVRPSSGSAASCSRSPE